MEWKELMENQEDIDARREYFRKQVLLEANIIINKKEFICEILNISAGGAKIRMKQTPKIGEKVSMDIDPFGEFPGEVVWVHEKEVGIRFKNDPRLSAEAVLDIAIYG